MENFAETISNHSSQINYQYVLICAGKAHDSTIPSHAKQYPGCTLYTRKKSGGKSNDVAFLIVHINFPSLHKSHLVKSFVCRIQ